ncbi:helix-turn-helix transcriptional regulator [Campylobacterota bacterium]
MSSLHDYDKILTRLTIILQRLYEGESLSVSALAEEFNVSSKTIQRDFNERLIRFPIEKHGRMWKMQSGYELTKERTPEETLVIEMLENIAESIGAGFGAKAKMLFSKLQNHTKNPIHSKTIIEDLSDKLDLFHELEDAITKHAIVMFNYNNKLRHIKPYKIVSFEGYWYLYGEELLENKLKTFYFKDINNIKITDETFVPDDHTYKVLERSINAWFEPNKEPFEVILNVSPAIAKYFNRRPLATTQRIVKIYEDDSMDIALLATADREILHEVKKWMPDLIIVSPKQLALQAKEIADNFLKRQIEHLIQ